MLDDRTITDAAQVADRIADSARRMIRTGLGSRTVTYKSDGSEVTDVDVAVNDMVIAAIADTFGDHQVLGEESSGLLVDLDRPTWVVDPIDGTMPYSAGVGVACFSLALVVAGEPWVAVADDPWTGLRWAAVRGTGTYRNGIRCTTSSQTSLHGARVDVEADADFVALIDTLTGQGALAFCQWAAVRTGCAVADGGYAAALYGPGKPWDVAATSLLVTEAGGKVGHVDGTPLHAARPIGRWAAAATPQLWDEIAELWAAIPGPPSA